MRILQNSKFSVKKSYTQLIHTLSFPGRSPVLGKYETLEKIRKKNVNPQETKKLLWDCEKIRETVWHTVKPSCEVWHQIVQI